MRLVKVKHQFYDLCKTNNVENELLFNERGRPCVLIVQLVYKGNNLKFVVPLRSNISSRTPSSQYFALPPNQNTRAGCHHGVHYVKLFPITDEYIDAYRVDDENHEYYDTIYDILNRNESRIIRDCQNYLRRYEIGKGSFVTPDIDGILVMLNNIN